MKRWWRSWRDWLLRLCHPDWPTTCQNNTLSGEPWRRQTQACPAELPLCVMIQIYTVPLHSFVMSSNVLLLSVYCNAMSCQEEWTILDEWTYFAGFICILRNVPADGVDVVFPTEGLSSKKVWRSLLERTPRTYHQPNIGGYMTGKDSSKRDYSSHVTSDWLGFRTPLYCFHQSDLQVWRGEHGLGVDLEQKSKRRERVE